MWYCGVCLDGEGWVLVIGEEIFRIIACQSD